jgi:hypothetical protein
MDLYSDSAEERETVCCFLDFQEMRESPIKTQQPVMDLRVSKHPAQSASQKGFMAYLILQGRKGLELE